MLGYRLYNGVRLLDLPCQANVRRLDMGAMPMILRMEQNGLMIDPDHFRNLSTYLLGEEERLSDEFARLTGYRINLGSPDQTADVLFSSTKLAIKPSFKIPMVKSGKRPKLDEGVLDMLVSTHPCILAIKQWRECNKMRTSYSDVLPRIMHPDQRVRTTLRATRQVTGRISSSEPNLMAQPTRSDLGKRIRDGYIAPKGKKLGTIDLSQIEMRLAAHMSTCWPMLDTFLRNGDIHDETASRMFRIPIPQLDKMAHRYPAKRIGFGVLYGITKDGLYDQMVEAGAKGWTVEKCAELIEMWFAAYPEIKVWMHEQHSRARRFGFVWDLIGRIRWVPEVRSVHRGIVGAGERQAGNTPIQSTAQAIIKLVMCQLMDIILEDWTIGGEPLVEPLLQVHDELLFEGEESVLEDFMFGVAGPVIENICPPLQVPLKWGAGVGDCWGKLEK